MMPSSLQIFFRCLGFALFILTASLGLGANASEETRSVAAAAKALVEGQ